MKTSAEIPSCRRPTCRPTRRPATARTSMRSRSSPWIRTLDVRPSAPGRSAVVEAMIGHVLAKGVLVGAYERV